MGITVAAGRFTFHSFFSKACNAARTFESNELPNSTMSPWTRNRLTGKLGIEYPIIQGPFGGLASQRLTAAVSNFGGLGSFGAYSLTPQAINDVIAEIRSLTSNPFAMNLWVSTEDDRARTSDESA